MAEHQYYSEEVLIEKMERGEYGWLDYVNHFSPEWQEEYAAIARSTALWRARIRRRVRPLQDEQLEAAMENGDA